MPRPVAVTLIGTFLLGLSGGRCRGNSSGGAPEDNGTDRFKNLPRGWTVTRSFVAPDQQLEAVGKKLGGQVVRLSNTTLSVDGQQIQVNIIACKSDEDAARVHEAMLRVRRGFHAACPREGKSVVEFVCKDMKLIERAYSELGFKPPRVTYQVSFQAAPVEKCDPLAWNKMFNAFLAAEPDGARIGELARSFTFGEQIHLRNYGQGNEKSSFSLTPRPVTNKPEAAGDLTTYAFADLRRQHGVPQVAVVATVTSEAFALTADRRKAGRELLGPTEFWPSTDPEIVALAKEITGEKVNARDKTAAILAWFAAARNLKYGGADMGSRYGVKKVLKQGFGRCWDFSDCFVTLCRASGVPSRQVLGWLHGESGHVWAEVLIEGVGWKQVDPTAGMGCDSRYIPYIATETGKVPLVYTSPVVIREMKGSEK